MLGPRGGPTRTEVPLRRGPGTRRGTSWGRRNGTDSDDLLLCTSAQCAAGESDTLRSPSPRSADLNRRVCIEPRRSRSATRASRCYSDWGRVLRDATRTAIAAVLRVFAGPCHLPAPKRMFIAATAGKIVDYLHDVRVRRREIVEEGVTLSGNRGRRRYPCRLELCRRLQWVQLQVDQVELQKREWCLQQTQISSSFTSGKRTVCSDFLPNRLLGFS